METRLEGEPPGRFFGVCKGCASPWFCPRGWRFGRLRPDRRSALALFGVGPDHAPTGPITARAADVPIPNLADANGRSAVGIRRGQRAEGEAAHFMIITVGRNIRRTGELRPDREQLGTANTPSPTWDQVGRGAGVEIRSAGRSREAAQAGLAVPAAGAAARWASGQIRGQAR